MQFMWWICIPYRSVLNVTWLIPFLLLLLIRICIYSETVSGHSELIRSFFFFWCTAHENIKTTISHIFWCKLFLFSSQNYLLLWETDCLFISMFIHLFLWLFFLLLHPTRIHCFFHFLTRLPLCKIFFLYKLSFLLFMFFFLLFFSFAIVSVFFFFICLFLLIKRFLRTSFYFIEPHLHFL